MSTHTIQGEIESVPFLIDGEEVEVFADFTYHDGRQEKIELSNITDLDGRNLLGKLDCDQLYDLQYLAKQKAREIKKECTVVAQGQREW